MGAWLPFGVLFLGLFTKILFYYYQRFIYGMTDDTLTGIRLWYAIYYS